MGDDRDDGKDVARADTALLHRGTDVGGAARWSVPIMDLDESRYRLGDLLGQGGMGEIVLAFDEQIGREVVVKRILAEQPSAEQVARFIREARVQGRLEHPAVVPVHDLAIDRDGRPFFVMKRLAGVDLAELLEGRRLGHQADGAAAPRRLWRAFVDVCLAVEFAHSRGIVHRDLKPANIMLGEYGEVYVIDWGIARAPAVAEPAPPDAIATADLGLDTGQTRAGALLGTPAYMAPEQLAGEPAGPAADIYALGCILYEITVGVPLHPPTRSLSGDAVPVPRPSPAPGWRADAPPELEAICARATATDPAARFASARALADTVQAFLDGDRDLSARRTLARDHVAEARAALARGDGEDERRIAMRAAGRALALDPTATEAAEVVTHLMLTPPTRTPDEVVRTLEAIEFSTGRAQGRIGALAMTGYLGFLPLLWWTGIRDEAILVAFATLAVLNAGWVYAMTWLERIPQSGIYLSACVHAALIAVVCRLVGPFMIAPTLVLTTLMAYAVHPQFGRVTVIAAILTAGVAIPWGLEVAGLLAPTYRFEDGAIVLSSPAVTFSSTPVQLAFLVLLVLMAAVVAVLLRAMAGRQRDVTKRIELQAWQLRQVVPADHGGVPASDDSRAAPIDSGGRRA